MPLAGFAAAALLALVVALRAPAGLAVAGLAVFGALHNVLELRYVAGRFRQVLAGPFLRLLLALITGIVVCRLLPPGPASRAAEILLAYGLLAVASARALRRRPWAPAAAAVVWATAAGTSLAFPAYHFVVLAHLHNLVPLVFLWEWSRGLPRGRAAFLAVQFGWVLAVPLLLLSGALDAWLAPGTGFTARLAVAYSPPAWLHTAAGLRFVAVFAFLQTMHYVVWVWFLPRYAPDAAAAFERRVPWLGGWRAWALGAAAGARSGCCSSLTTPRAGRCTRRWRAITRIWSSPSCCCSSWGSGPRAGPPVERPFRVRRRHRSRARRLRRSCRDRRGRGPAGGGRAGRAVDRPLPTAALTPRTLRRPAPPAAAPSTAAAAPSTAAAGPGAAAVAPGHRPVKFGRRHALWFISTSR
ncbi:hypothetical protein [Kitasatospora paranensis]|uniref:hypothetical protein n=1 Tax=Kitasatospora paranensis TaxID=258053 RepID=UPI0031F02AE1